MSKETCEHCGEVLSEDGWQIVNGLACTDCWESLCADAWWIALDKLQDTEGV